MFAGGTYREEYVREALAYGWTCPNKACGVWNGDEKEFLLSCRCCSTNRPRKLSVERGTKGKR